MRDYEVVILNDKQAINQDAKQFSKIGSVNGINYYKADRYYFISDGKKRYSKQFNKNRYIPLYAYIDSYMVKMGNFWGCDDEGVNARVEKLLSNDNQVNHVRMMIAEMEANGVI